MNSTLNRKAPGARRGDWRLAVGLVVAGCATAHADAPVDLARQVIVGEAEYEELVQTPYMPPVFGTQVYSGKKTTVLDLDDLPPVLNNNYRQALTKAPGLLLSEETTPLVSVGYRGLNPHRMQFTQVLKDGIPIHADPFGYPEAYYTPPLDTVDRLEFVRGGASLMYGPQPGGSLNYVTHRPRLDRPFSARTQHVLGSDNLYSTYTSMDGTSGRLGYYAYFNHRRTDGFRSANSDVALYTGSARLVLDAKTDSRWHLTYDGYGEEHGEPGGLAAAPGPGAVEYARDRAAATRLFDRFLLDRHFAALAWEKDFAEDSRATVTGWGGYYSRVSRRQTGGGFGVLATGQGNTIEDQRFFTQGLEGRVRHGWGWDENQHAFAAGVQAYHTASPRVDLRGASPVATSGTLLRDTDRSVLYTPVFAENRFVWGDLSITPGVRLENMWQGVRENVNVDKAARGTPLGDVRDHDFVPLGGLGLEYTLPRESTAYANLSQAYRPKLYSEAVPTSGGAVANRDLAPGQSWQADVGLRGRPLPFVHWDTSVFWMNFDDQLGTVGNTVQNIGRTVHRGLEASVELELMGLTDRLQGGEGRGGEQEFALHANVMWLHAEIESSANPALVGNTPAYAPGHLVRAGAVYRWLGRGKVAFTGTVVGEHNANDSNAAAYAVPSYMTWDLTLEWKVWQDRLSVLGGVNNLLDERYFARVRPDGIDPAYGRNFYAGLMLAF